MERVKLAKTVGDFVGWVVVFAYWPHRFVRLLSFVFFHVQKKNPLHKFKTSWLKSLIKFDTKGSKRKLQTQVCV